MATILGYSGGRVCASMTNTPTAVTIDTLTELSQAQVEVEKAWAAYRRAAEEAHYAAVPLTRKWQDIIGTPL